MLCPRIRYHGTIPSVGQRKHQRRPLGRTAGCGCWVKSARSQSHDLVPTGSLHFSEVLRDDRQIAIALTCMRHTSLADLINYGITHLLSPLALRVSIFRGRRIRRAPRIGELPPA